MKPADPDRMRDEDVPPAPSSCRPSQQPSSRHYYGLRPQLHACAIGATLIFLDIDQDRYFGLTGDDAKAFRTLYEYEGITPLTENLRLAAGRFIRMDLLREIRSGAPACRPSVRPPPIGSAYGVVRHAKIRPVSLLRALLSSLALTRLRPFRHMISAARSWKTSLPCGSNQLYEAIDHARSLHRLTPYLFTRHEACLFRSLLLLRYLRLFGIPADWEFGVRLAPFCAHCWVEYEGIVLNDHQDKTLTYTNILYL